MDLRDELSRKCILLKSVDETIEVGDVRNSLLAVGEQGKRFHRYTEQCEDDVRWIVLLESEKGALKCIQDNNFTIKTEENKVFNVVVGFCPECIIPSEWIEEESKTLHDVFMEEDQREAVSKEEDEFRMNADNSLTENNIDTKKSDFEDYDSFETKLTSSLSKESPGKPSHQDINNDFLDCPGSIETVKMASGGFQNLDHRDKNRVVLRANDDNFITSLHGFSGKEETGDKGDNSFSEFEVRKEHGAFSDDDSDDSDSSETHSSEDQQDDEQDISGFESENYPTSIHYSDRSSPATIDESSENPLPTRKSEIKDSSESDIETDSVREEPYDLPEKNEFSLQRSFKSDSERQDKYTATYNIPKTQIQYGSNSEKQKPLCISETMVTDINLKKDQKKIKKVRKSHRKISLQDDDDNENDSDDDDDDDDDVEKDKDMATSKHLHQNEENDEKSLSENGVSKRSRHSSSSSDSMSDGESKSESDNLCNAHTYEQLIQNKTDVALRTPQSQVSRSVDTKSSVTAKDSKLREESQSPSEPVPDKFGNISEKTDQFIEKDKTSEALETKTLPELNTAPAADQKNYPHQPHMLPQGHSPILPHTHPDKNTGNPLVYPVNLATSQKNDSHQPHILPQGHTPMVPLTYPYQNTGNPVVNPMNLATSQKNDLPHLLLQGHSPMVPNAPSHPVFPMNYGVQSPLNVSQQWFGHPTSGQSTGMLHYPHYGHYPPAGTMWHGYWAQNSPYPQGPVQTPGTPEQPYIAMPQHVLNANQNFNLSHGYHMPVGIPSQNSNQLHSASGQNSEKRAMENPNEKTETSIDATSKKTDHEGIHKEPPKKPKVPSHTNAPESDLDHNKNNVDKEHRKKQKQKNSRKKSKNMVDSEDDLDNESHDKPSEQLIDDKERSKVDGEKHTRDVRPKTTAGTYSDWDSEGACCGITVYMSGVISEDLLECYFENKKRSGGDEIKHKEYSAATHQAYIEFYDSRAVDRIIEKGTEHQISGVTLFVSKCQKGSPKVMDDYKILLNGLNPLTKQDCLFDFLEVNCGVEATDILYGEDPDTVLVMFDDKPDISKLQKVCKKKPLEGHYLEVSKVPLSTSIRISNVSEDLDEDELHYYFENRKKSNGGEIVKITLHQKLELCVISFRNNEVVDRVCSRRHKLHNQTLEVEEYHSCLGLLGGKEYRTSLELPSPIIRSGIDPNIIKFLAESQSHKSSFEKELLKHYAKVEWPGSTDSETLKFICILKLTDPKAPQILQSWEKSIQDVVNHFLDVITTEYISVAKELWRSAMAGLQNINIQHPEGVIVISQQEDYTIVLVGHKTIVTSLRTQIQKILTSEESKLKAKVTMTERLKSYQVRILNRKKFSGNIKDVDVKLDLNKNHVIFYGSSEKINSLKLQMYETLQKFVSKKMPVSTGIKTLLSKKEVCQMINKEMKTRGIMGIWDLPWSNSNLEMFAESSSEVKDAVEVVKSCILEKSVPMKGMLGKYLNTSRWKKTLKSLEAKHQGLAYIEGDRDSITVTATEDVFKSIFKSVEREVRDYVEINSISSETVFDKEGVFLYMEKYQTHRIQEIVRPLTSQYQISVSPIPGPSSFGYSVKGNRDTVEIVKKQLEELMRNIQIEKFLISRTGAKDYFLSSKGHECIRQAETISRCIIKVSGKDKRGKKLTSKTRDVKKRGGNDTYESEPDLVAQCQHDEQRNIKVMEGDMTKLRVDAIVNAANEDMSHGGGIAAAIVKAGGQSIQDECYRYVEKYGSVEEGNAISSTSGRLPCKIIIHTVGPTWHDGKQNEEKLLKKAVINSLKLASNKKMSSIAFPAISAGIFGYPLDLSTKVIVEAIKDYFSYEWKDSNILEVYLCDIDDKTISAFIKALEKEYEKSDVKKIESSGKSRLKREISYSCSESENSDDEDSGSNSNSDHSDRSDQSDQSDHEYDDKDDTEAKGATGGGKLSYPSSNTYQSNGDKSSRSHDHGSSSQTEAARKFKSSGDNIIKVKKEELSKHMAEVIVNSTQADLDLNAGVLSRSLLMAAGNAMQAECRQKYPNGIKTGQIAITKGGNLSCSHVYHGTLKKWDGGKGDALQTMEALVESCLESASKHDVSSISFPALGTGKLGYPADIAAQTMFQCIQRYLKQNKTTSIKEVNIVVFPKDTGTLKAFESVENGYHSSRSSKHESDVLKYPHPPKGGENPSEHGHTGGSHGPPPPKTKIGQLMVSIVVGDITKETSHAVVNSTGEKMDLSKGAVSKAILKAAGSQIQDECQQKGKKLTTEKLVVTSGGHMQCKVIFHVKVQKEADGWERVVAMCLYEADRRRFSSVSFPALGTGGQGCSPDDVAKAMFKAMRKFSSQPQNLKYVRIVVFQKNMVDRFIAGLEKKESEGLLSKIKEKAGQAYDVITDTVQKGIKYLTEDETKPKPKVKSRPKKVDAISFTIYSDSRDSIKKAKKKLDDTYDSEFNEKSISGNYTEAITNLTEKQKTEVEKICKTKHVTVNVNKQKGSIELKGHKNNVSEAQCSISDYLHGEDKKKDNYDKAKTISKYVQWCYEDNKKMKTFSPDVNSQLETAYSNKDKTCRIKDRKGVTYVVDFKTMEEIILSQPGVKIKVERRETNTNPGGEKLPLPKTWTSMKHDEILKVIPLKPGDKEYEKVKSEFTKSAQAQKSIIKIDRIQNKALYQQYAAKRSELRLRNGKNPERWLWHGTSPDTLSKVNYNGFNRSYCGKNGTAYGQGVYFAVNASLSLGYCSADRNGQYHMYCVQVLTGDSCQGNGGMRFLPPKGSSSPITYDSATDSSSNPNMFVIFHDSQAYPTYHITFK